MAKPDPMMTEVPEADDADVIALVVGTEDLVIEEAAPSIPVAPMVVSAPPTSAGVPSVSLAPSRAPSASLAPPRASGGVSVSPAASRAPSGVSVAPGVVGVAVVGIGNAEPKPKPERPRRPISTVGRPIKERDRRATAAADARLDRAEPTASLDLVIERTASELPTRSLAPRPPSSNSGLPSAMPSPLPNPRAEKLYQQAIAELEKNQRTQALTSLRLAMSFAPEETRYARAYEHVRMGGRLDA
ncbi:MAG: hypothetical protein U1E65_22215 [Myxococcota bacterium]